MCCLDVALARSPWVAPSCTRLANEVGCSPRENFASGTSTGSFLQSGHRSQHLPLSVDGTPKPGLRRKESNLHRFGDCRKDPVFSLQGGQREESWTRFRRTTEHRKFEIHPHSIATCRPHQRPGDLTSRFGMQQESLSKADQGQTRLLLMKPDLAFDKHHFETNCSSISQIPVRFTAKHGSRIPSRFGEQQCSSSPGHLTMMWVALRRWLLHHQSSSGFDSRYWAIAGPSQKKSGSSTLPLCGGLGYGQTNLPTLCRAVLWIESGGGSNAEVG